MSFKFFENYIRILSVCNELITTISNIFLGDDYLSALWYPKNTELITIKKEYQGHTYLFKVVSVGNKTVSGQINDQSFQFENEELDKLRSEYNLNDSSISGWQLSQNEKVFAFTNKKGEYLEFNETNGFELMVACDDNQLEPLRRGYFSLKDIFIPFDNFYYATMKFISSHNKFLKPSFLAQDVLDSPIPSKEQYIINVESLFNTLTQHCSQNNIKLELSADFLGFEYQSSIWYMPQTELANFAYKQGAITIFVEDSSQAIGYISNKYVNFTTAGESTTPGCETIDDMRLFYGLCDRDITELRCSFIKDYAFLLVEPSNFVINYYVKGKKIKTEKTNITDLIEVILKVYFQNFAKEG
ncbi:MAG: hypothetical protein ACI37Z_08945 [Candidatus Gastranaerophilaceae bacterium]